jgi:hypothetical protein
LVVDLSRNIDDLLREIDIESTEGLERVPYYRDIEGFLSAENGFFKIRYVPADAITWPKLAKRFGRFIRAKFPLDMFGRYQMFISNPFWLLVENACTYGNCGDVTLPVDIEFFFSPKGFLIKIKDCGKGFDTKKVLDLKRRGEVYYQNGGGAFHIMEEDKANVYSYNKKGNEAYMLCLLERNLVTQDR